MSAALPYLQKLRKSDLSEIAESTKLPNYDKLKKVDLEAALDGHLQANATTLSKDPSLNDYYSRLSTTTRSPVKRIAQKVSDIIKSDDDVPPTAKKSRRKTRSPEDDATDTDGPLDALVKTPAKEIARRSSAVVANMLPPSPAVVTDAIDHQTKRIRNSISHAYDHSPIHEYSDHIRDLLSSSVTINVLAILIEAYGLRAEILPNKLLTELPPVPYLKSTRTQINVPDLFSLLSLSFWAPFTLWILTTLVTPALVSYFVNMPLKQVPGHSYNTRRASIKHSPQMQFDPFIFNLTKGLMSFLVFAGHLRLGLFSHYTISLVNTCVPGGYSGMLLTAGLGAVVSLYEAVLKKH